eukprot:scaffold1084_cov250-Ochromonas_danica.AAC.9
MDKSLCEDLTKDVEEKPAHTTFPKPVLTNFQILLGTSILFGAFVIAEIIGALASNSLSLLGDGSAMAVDVFTYVCNMYAEHVKAKHGGLDGRTKRFLEVYIPSFSVCALLAVTGWITSDAITVIKNKGENDDVSVVFLFAFASGNFVVDFISSTLFYLKKETVLKNEQHLHTFSLDRRSADWSKRGWLPNLNMISALTHVGSDTMRTTSVFVAAIIAEAGHLDSSLCDAWASIVVTISILIAIIPLCKEIFEAATGKHDALLKDVQERASSVSEV